MHFSGMGKRAKQLHRDAEVVQSDTAAVGNSPQYLEFLVPMCDRQNHALPKASWLQSSEPVTMSPYMQK